VAEEIPVKPPLVPYMVAANRKRRIISEETRNPNVNNSTGQEGTSTENDYLSSGHHFQVRR